MNPGPVQSSPVTSRELNPTVVNQGIYGMYDYVNPQFKAASSSVGNCSQARYIWYVYVQIKAAPSSKSKQGIYGTYM